MDENGSFGQQLLEVIGAQLLIGLWIAALTGICLGVLFGIAKLVRRLGHRNKP